MGKYLFDAIRSYWLLIERKIIFSEYWLIYEFEIIVNFIKLFKMMVF